MMMMLEFAKPDKRHKRVLADFHFGRDTGSQNQTP